MKLALKKLESDLNFPGRFREEEVNKDWPMWRTDISEVGIHIKP